MMNDAWMQSFNFLQILGCYIGIGWDHSCNSCKIVRTWCLVSVIGVVRHCCNLLCLMLDTRARVPWFQIWTCYCIMMIIIVLDHIYELYTNIIIRNRWPQSDNNWDNQREWLWCEDLMYSRSGNALLWYFIKRNTLIASSFPWAPVANGLAGQKMMCKFLNASTHNHCSRYRPISWFNSWFIAYHCLTDKINWPISRPIYR